MLRNGSIPTPPGFSFGPAAAHNPFSSGPPQPPLLLCLNQRPQQGGTVAVCAPPTTPASLQAGRAGVGVVRNLAASLSSSEGSNTTNSICSVALEVVSGDGAVVAR